MLNGVPSASLTLSADSTTVLEQEDDIIQSPHRNATWYPHCSPALVSSCWLKSRAALPRLGHTHPPLFSSSLMLNYHCKDESKCFCLMDFNPVCDLRSFLLGVHLAVVCDCERLLWSPVLTFCCTGVICASVWEEKGICSMLKQD